MKKIFIFLLLFVVALNVAADVTEGSQTSLQGKITDKSGEPIIGVNIYLPELKTGASTDAQGFYQIDNLPKHRLSVQINSVGYKMISEIIDLSSTTHKDYVMKESVTEIAEVTVRDKQSLRN